MSDTEIIPPRPATPEDAIARLIQLEDFKREREIVQKIENEEAKALTRHLKEVLKGNDTYEVRMPSGGLRHLNATNYGTSFYVSAVRGKPASSLKWPEPAEPAEPLDVEFSELQAEHIQELEGDYPAKVHRTSASSSVPPVAEAVAALDDEAA